MNKLFAANRKHASKQKQKNFFFDFKKLFFDDNNFDVFPDVKLVTDFVVFCAETTGFFSDLQHIINDSGKL